jgi:SAM-dependent methyltransferase
MPRWLGPGIGAAPRDLRWLITRPVIERSRRRKYEHFWRTFQPTPQTRVLDVGLANTGARLTNFLEAWYPWPQQIVGVSLYPLDECRRVFPEVRLVRGDGLRLPFAGGSFDVAFCNAVIEHVGSRQRQRQLVDELLRVARRVFLTTPDRHFPVDPHTLTPFAHWLPVEQRSRIYRRLGQSMWASEDILNPLTSGDLVDMFPTAAAPVLHRGRVLGLSANLTVIATSPAGD